MSSWFGIDKFQELKNKVTSSLPIGDENLFGKLTLTTPELTAERERIEKEERRKEQVRDYLAEILPWETRDEEREILVEDCRDVILALSKREETFTSPYTCPGLGETLRDGNNQVGDDDDDSDGVDGTNENDKNASSGEKKETKPGPNTEIASGLSAEEKLEKLEPLPPLLDNFDLDVHVGLIQRLLEVDPNLVEMQSLLSGGGEKEKTFWRNYFFHCAYARYEIGLSVEEIWASKPPPPSAEEIVADSYHGSASSAAATGGGSASDYDDDNHDDDVDGTSEDEITFEDPSGIGGGGGGKESSVRGVNGSVSAASSISSIPTSSSVPGTGTAAKSSPSGVDVARGVLAPSSSPTSTAGTDYELIDDDTGGFDNDIGGGDNDQDLDDLEAEIARELED